MVDTLLGALDVGYFELSEAFRDLPDDLVWKRPAPGLLSIGELAAHVAYGNATNFAGEGKIESPFVDRRFEYYPHSMAVPPSEEHRAMTAAQVLDEVLRVSREAVAVFKALNPSLDERCPGNPENFSYRDYLHYAVL